MIMIIIIIIISVIAFVKKDTECQILLHNAAEAKKYMKAIILLHMYILQS